MDGGVHQMVNDGSHSEDATQNTHDVDEERVPLIVRVDVEHGHWVGFVSS